MALFAERNQKIGSENAFKVGPHIVHVDKSRGPVVKLNLGEPDYDLPKAVNAEIKRQLDLGNTHYCDPQGTPNLRSAISEYVNRTRGLKTTPGHVVVFPGGKPSIGLTQQIYCNPGDEVIYPSPGFPIYESFIRYVQAFPVPLHLDESAGFTFTSQQLEELITPRTKVIYLNFPSNPTGGVASQAQIEEIADVISETLAPFGREGGENPASVVEDLREMMQEKVGIIRTGTLLNEALSDLDELEKRAAITSPGGSRIYNPGWHQALELGAMIDVSRMCALAALQREESRGGHTRDDFPESDHKHWGKVNSVITQGKDGSMEIEHTSYPAIDEELKALLDADDLDQEGE